MSDLTDNLFYQQRLEIVRHYFKDQPRNCDLTPLNYYLWGAVKDKCFAEKPDTIGVLKDNIGKIQMHTTDNVLKNWTDRVGYSMASRDIHLNKIISHY